MDNQVSAPKVEKKVEPVVKRLPEDTVKKLEEYGKKRQELTRQLLNLSIQEISVHKAKEQTLDTINNSEKGFQKTLQQAFKKLKLHKKPGYEWRFNGKDEFLGYPKPPKAKAEEKK